MSESFSKRLKRWDKKYTWHPFTQMKDWERDEMVVIDSAKGNQLMDTDGQKYLDGVSSLWCNVHGHRVPSLDRALQKQLKKVAHSTFLGLSNTPAVLLSKKLVEIAPKGLTRVFYSDSGSEAVEVALKISYQYWQHLGQGKKKTFVRFSNAYHGDTIGSTSVGGINLFHAVYGPLLFKTIKADSPYRYRDSFRGGEKEYLHYCLNRFEKIVKKNSKKICAVILEPLIQGAAGMIIQPKGFISGVRKITERCGILLIFDEVATGFGRTGKMFACNHEKVTPDILCLAKGITGGYLPLSATLLKEKIYRAFLGEYREFKTFFHGHTYTANPLACAVALASLKLFKEKKVLESLQPKIKLFREELNRFKCLDHVGDIRQAGLMIGIELVKDKKTKAPYPLEEKRGIRVALTARPKGVMIRPLGNVIVLIPPLSISLSEIKKLCRVVYESIQEVTCHG